MKRDGFNKLLDKFYSDRLTEREKAEFERKLESSAHARKVFHNVNRVRFALESVEADKELSGGFASRMALRSTRLRRILHPAVAACIAAAVIIPLLIFTVNTIVSNGKVQEVLYTEVASTNSKVTHVTLPDGSRVALYSGSLLRYPEKFTQNERRVQLKGEATFEVKSDRQNPFFVNTLDGIQVKAYGTKFNVCGYEKENTIQVYLTRGAVDFIAPSLTEPVTLQPEMRLSYGRVDRSVTMTHKGPEEYAAHEQGVLMFRKTPLKEIIQRVSRMYNTEIVVENEEILHYTYTGSFRDETLYQIMDLITKSSHSLRWSITGETIFLSKE